MKKRTTAFLTALLCVMSTAAIPSSAAFENPQEYFEGEDGRLCSVTHRAIEGLYVKTDGTALNEEMASAFGTVSGVCTVGEHLSLPQDSGLDTLDSDGYILSVSLNMSEEEILNLGRKLMTQVDFVEDVQVLSYEEVNDYPIPNFCFYTERVSEDTEVDLSAMPELSPYFEYSDDVFDYPTNCSGELRAKDDLFSEKFYAETAQDPYSYFTYDSYEYLAEFGKSIQEKYSDVFSSVTPQFLYRATHTSRNYTSSIWQDAGDNDDDGNVTAEDAAGMLTLAAQIGTGADIKATSANDVNSDGTVNAEDAAAVLAYAAANGSGNEVSWVDILRR